MTQSMKRQLACLGGAALLATGCASADLTVIQPLSTAAPTVSLSVAHSPSVDMTDEQRSRLRTTLTTALVDAGVSLVAVGDAGASALLGEVDLFRPGSRPLRYFVGFGAGRGRFASRWAVLSPGGEELGSCRIDGGIVMGVFGGSYDDVLEKVGERLGDFLLGRD